MRFPVESLVHGISQIGTESIARTGVYDLAARVARLLRAEGCLIMAVNPDEPYIVESMSFVFRGEVMSDIAYDCRATPCFRVASGQPVFIGRALQSQFPEDEMLSRFGLQAYAGVPLRDVRGYVIGLLVVFYQDEIDDGGLLLDTLKVLGLVIAPKLAEALSAERLVAVERRARLVLGSMIDGVLMVHPDGVIAGINPAGAGLLGWKEEDLVGRHFHRTLQSRRPDGSDLPEQDCALMQTLGDATGRRGNSESLVTGSGGFVEVCYTCSPILDDLGQVRGAVLTFSPARP